MSIASGRLNYGPKFERRAQNGPKGAAFIVAHELGHALGLRDQGVNPFPPTVMNNLENCSDLPQTSNTVTGTDAMRVAGCIQKASDPLADDYEDRPNGTFENGVACYDRYLVTSYYTCAVTGTTCFLEYKQYTPVGIVCY
jgi:hypothetical protein